MSHSAKITKIPHKTIFMTKRFYNSLLTACNMTIFAI